MDPLPPSTEQLLRFLEAVPLTHETHAALDQFKTALCELLGDVDRVSILINFEYDLHEIERHQIALVQQIEGGEEIPAAALPPASADDALEYFRRSGARVDHFQKPVILNFLADGHDRFATVYLWRQLGASPISEVTISLVLSLHKLMISLFLNLIYRRTHENPEQKAFIGALARLVEDTGMTTKQNQILIRLLGGASYQEIATSTGVTVDAVGRAIGRLYKRVGVKSYAELYRKYFVPVNVS